MNKFTNTFKAFVNYQQHRTECGHYPLQIWIEPTSHCNLKCVMCPNDSLKPSQKGHMPMERFRKIIDDIHPYVGTVTICDRGEPLLNKDLCNMIKYANSRGLTTKTSTNGTLLNEKYAIDIINSGLSVISFSFDGYKKDVYEGIRVGSDFEKVLSNIQRFIKLKKELNSKTPHVTLQVIEIEPSDRIEIRDFWKRFGEFTPDRVYIKSAHNWGGNVDADRARNNGDGTAGRHFMCNSPWYSLVIHWDGTVYPCTLDYAGKYPIGHIDTDNWLDIWNGDRMKTLRSEMESGKLTQCGHCLNCDKLHEKKILGISTGNLFNETMFRIKMYLGT